MIDRRATRSPSATVISRGPIGSRTDLRVAAVTEGIAQSDFGEEEERRLALLGGMPNVISLFRKLSGVASAAGVPREVAREVHRITGEFVLVEDWAATTSCVEPKSAPVNIVPPNWRNLSDIEHARAFRNGDWLITVARPEEALLGAICVFDPDIKIGADLAVLIEAAAAVLSFALVQVRALADVELRIWDDLASELLDAPLRSSSRRHAAALGYDVDRPHRVVAIDLAEQRAGSTEAAVRRIAPAVRLSTPLMTARDGLLLLLVSEDVDWMQFGSLLARELGSRPRIGIGRLHHLDSMRESVAEAELALRMSTSGVVEVEDLGVLGFLAADADPNRLHHLVDQWIGALITYDGAHHSELVATLGEYLRSQGGIEITARRLFVHANTVKYRIRQIRELTQLDLHDADTRFNLELACRAHQVLDALSQKT